MTVIMTMSPTRVVSAEAIESRPPGVRSRPPSPRGSWIRSVTCVRRSWLTSCWLRTSMKRAVQLAAIATANTHASTPIQNHRRPNDAVATASSTARPTTTGVTPLQTKDTAIAPEARKLHGLCERATLRVHQRASTGGISDLRPPGPGSAA